MNSSCAPSESSGTSTTSTADGPSSGAERDQQHDLGDAQDVGQHARRQPGGQQQPDGEDDVAGQAAFVPALQREAHDVLDGEQQQHDHHARPDRHRDELALRVVARLVEARRRRLRASVLTRGQLAGRDRHRVEVLELRAEQDALGLAAGGPPGARSTRARRAP